MCEPDALKFLNSHGFDFNRQIQNGINYYKGNDKETSTKEYLRDLFREIYLANVPIVLHNGFIDLIFLYENFYAKLPDCLNKFTADLSDIFQAALFDTKYIADFVDRSNASFLEYLYSIS